MTTRTTEWWWFKCKMHLYTRISDSQIWSDCFRLIEFELEKFMNTKNLEWFI